MSTSVRDGQRGEHRGAGGNRAEISGGGPTETATPAANCESRLPSDAPFELLPAAADQVIADVRFTGIRRTFCDLPRTFDTLECHTHLALASGFSQLFDGVAVVVAAGEIHLPVHG